MDTAAVRDFVYACLTRFPVLAFMLVFLLFLAAAARAKAAETVSETLQKGLFEEEANHNLDAAIKAYQAVVQQTDEQRKFAATAIFRLGECYRKLGKTNEATGQYERVLREFSDQTALADLSRQTLGGFGLATSVVSNPGELAATEQEKFEVQRIKALIKDSPDLINSAGASDGMTPLHTAAQAGQLAVARFLLANKADVNARRRGGTATPLHFAASAGHRSMVELLLANGADVGAVGGLGGKGGTPLHDAAANGYKSVVELLLAKKADVNARNDEGQTPLHVAAAAGQLPIAELLLANGAEINVKDSGSETPLHSAVEHNHQAMVELLLSRKAEVDPMSKNGSTPLLLAVQKKNVGIAESLLKSGADVNLKREHLTSPLRSVLFTASPELLKVLLAHQPDLEAQDNEGLTVLQAAIYDRPAKGVPAEMVELLLAAGANANAPFRPVGEAVWLERNNRQSPITEQTPLMVAIRKQHPDFVEALLAHGAEVNPQSKNGETALHYAVESRSLPMVQAILARHPDTEIRDNEGCTPFRRIFGFGDMKLLEAFIRARADINAALPDGNTALHFAVGRRRKDIVELLVTNKADVNAINKDVETPLAWTESGRYSQAGLSQADHAILDDIAVFLLKHGADENIPRRSVIGVSRRERNLSFSVFFKGTNAYNRYTLLELLAASYIGPSSSGFGESAGQPAYPFPDFANVKIKRLSPKPPGNVDISIDLEKIFQSGDCSQDLDLEWGDVIEIPELDHAVNEGWPGLTRQTLETLKNCLKRDVEIVVKGEHMKLSLIPNTPTFPQPRVVPTRTPRDLPPGDLGAPGGFAPAAASPAPSQNSSKTIRTFRLKGVINLANAVRVSSDLSRVKLKRADSKSGQTQELLFNLSEGAPYDPRTDLWLRDGDVIEVPEK